MSLFSAALSFSQLFAGNLIPIKKMNCVVCFNSLKMLLEIGSANVQKKKKKRSRERQNTSPEYSLDRRVWPLPLNIEVLFI